MSWENRIGRRIKLRDLHVFIAVAENGSMAKAADRLNISHPVVSKAITGLEHSIGVPVFDRTPRGVTLTHYGRALLKTAVDVFDVMRQGMRRIEHLSDPAAGELRFGCPEAMAGGMVQEIVARFQRKYPAVLLDVVTADTAAHNFQELRDRDVEFLIGRVRVPFDDDELDAELLAKEGLVIVAGKDNPLTRRKQLALKDLVNEPWLLPPPDTLPGSMARDFFHAQGLELPGRRIVTFSLQLNFGFVALGHHLCVLPSSMLRFGHARNAVKALAVKLPPRDSAIGVLTVKNRTLSPMAERFLDIARQVAATLPTTKQPAYPAP